MTEKEDYIVKPKPKKEFKVKLNINKVTDMTPDNTSFKTKGFFIKDEYEDYPHTETITGDELHQLAVEHWDYVHGVILNSQSNINHNILDIIGFHYIQAFKHGWKHRDSQLPKKYNVKVGGN